MISADRAKRRMTIPAGTNTSVNSANNTIGLISRCKSRPNLNQRMFSGLSWLGEVRLIAVSPVAMMIADHDIIGLSRQNNATATASAANAKPVDRSDGGLVSPRAYVS